MDLVAMDGKDGNQLLGRRRWGEPSVFWTSQLQGRFDTGGEGVDSLDSLSLDF